MPCVSGSTAATNTDMRQTMPAKKRKMPNFMAHIIDKKLWPTTKVIKKFIAVLQARAAIVQGRNLEPSRPAFYVVKSLE